MTTNTIQMGETREVGTVRFHRYREGLKVTDLTNAGKRGKVVQELYVDVKYGPDAGDAGARLYDLCDLVFSTGNYSTVAALVECYVDEHSNSLRIDERTYKGIAVQPAGFEVICIRNEHMSLSAGYDDFGVHDLTDRNNEPRLIPTCHSGKKTAIKRWYAYVKANRKQLETATFSQVWEAMSKADVKTHYYCAVD